MTSTRLRTLLTSEGYEEFESPGFDAYRKNGREVRFFWWSSRKHAATLGVSRASLVARRPTGDDVHIPLVEWPSTDQPTRPWADVATDVRRHLED